MTTLSRHGDQVRDPVALQYEQPARSVRLRPGAFDDLPQVLEALGTRHAYALVSPSQGHLLDRLRSLLGDSIVGFVTTGAHRWPAEQAPEVLVTARAAHADVLVTVGGGSAIGVAKPVAAETRLPIVAVPTTYSGSEMTPVFGVVQDGRKQARHDWRAAARAVIYDPELTTSLSPALTAGSGTNALAQAIGSLYAQGSNPVASTYAVGGIKLVTRSLTQCVREPTDLDARSRMMLGAHLCGLALAMAGLSPHHELVHAVGDRTALPHAGLHAVVLPQTTSWAQRHVPEGADLLAEALGHEPGAGIYDLLGEIAAPRGLRELGLPPDRFTAALDDIVSAPPPSWRAADTDELADLLRRSYDGTRPAGP